MTDGFYHGKDKNYGVSYTPEELRMRSLETDAERICADDAAKLYRETVMPDDNGVVVICPEHGRTYHEYDFKKEKVMNRKISCPFCGMGEVLGEFKMDIPERSHEWEY